ncbi:MAG: hypothetical protein WC529_05030 [Candidatus Margulisiibacteriota bacterium]
MEYLWVCGLTSLVFGLLLLLNPSVLGTLGSVLNKVLFTVNGWTFNYRVWIGLGLLAIGAWMMYVGLSYPDPYITAAWVVTITFGLLFLVLPNWLKWLSSVSNIMLLSTDELVMGARRLIGVLMLIISLYIFYGIFYAIK